eukprot:g8923.t1
MSRQQQKGGSRRSSSGSRGAQRPSTTAGDGDEQVAPDHDEEDQGMESSVMELPGRGRGEGGRGRRSSFQDRLSSPSRGGVESKVTMMRTVFEKLVEVSQDEEIPEGLAETAEDLVSADVMNHSNSDYRLLVACCLVEILRIYAPDAPYSDDQVLATFALIITQLRGLGTAAIRPDDERTNLIYHLLESLATCKSCVIVALLANEGVPGGLEQLVEMFEVLLTGVRPEHDESILELVLETLQLCIGELHVMHQPLLDTVLIQLLPVTRKENPTSYNLAAGLLKVTLAKVQTPISHLVSGMLSGARGGAIESELKEHALPLVYELHKVTPNMLTFILPEVAEQLKAEDIDVRSGACTLLGRLFASKHADYGKEKPNIWAAFLGRFIDADVGIRRTMVEAVTMILLRKPELRTELHHPMLLRLQDPDPNVRSAAVKGVIDIANKDPTVLHKELLQAMGLRIKDRKDIIRQYACIGMSKAFKRHIGARWLPPQEYVYGVGGKSEQTAGRGKKSKSSKDPVRLKAPSAELTPKLGWIPAMVVKAMSLREDWDLRSKVLHLLDEVIVPAELRDEARAAVLAHLCHGMDMQARKGLAFVLKDKRVMRSAVVRYLDARDAFKAKKVGSTSGSVDKDLEAKLDASMEAVAGMHPSTAPSGKQLTLLKDLNGKQDKKIFRLLRVVCSPEAPHSVIAEARAELLKKVGTCTGLGAYLKTLTSRCSVLAVGVAGFQELCLACRRGMEQGLEDMFLPPLGLLETMVFVLPERAMGQEGHLAAVFAAAEENGLENEMMRILAVIAACRRTADTGGDADGSVGKEGGEREGTAGDGDGDDDDLPDGFLESLVDLCTKDHGTPAQAKAAVRALAALASDPTTPSGEAAKSSAIDALRETAANAAAVVGVVGSVSKKDVSRSSGRGGGGGGGDGAKAIGPAGVAALAAFAREFPREFARYEEKAMSFAVKRMTGTIGGGGGGGRSGADNDDDDEEEEEEEDEGAKGKGKAKRRTGQKKQRRGGGGKAAAAAAAAAAAGVVSPSCQTLCASIELACNCLMTSRRAGAADGVAFEEGEAWLKSVFGLLEAEGQPEGEGKMSQAELAELRLAGSTCVVRLCVSSPRAQSLLTPKRWHSLAWTLMDPSSNVRVAFLREVCRSLDQTSAAASGGGGGDGGVAAAPAAAAAAAGGGAWTLRFMAYLCLAAFESEQFKAEARSAIAKKVRQLRQVHAAAAAAAAAVAAAAAAATAGDNDSDDGDADGSGGGSPESSKKKAAAAAAAVETLMPEYVVPYAIHLLAHHPDFPANKDDKLRMRNLERYLDFLLVPLIGGQGEEADNLSMLLQMLDTITTSYEDALEPSSSRIHATARVARKILENRIRTQGNLQPFPGTIFLPAPLFQRRRAASPSRSLFEQEDEDPPGGDGASPGAAAGVGIGVGVSSSLSGRRRSSAASNADSSTASAGSGSGPGSTSRRVRRRTSASPESSSSQPQEEQQQEENSALSRSRRRARRSGSLAPASPAADAGPLSPALSPISSAAPSPAGSSQHADPSPRPAEGMKTARSSRGREAKAKATAIATATPPSTAASRGRKRAGNPAPAAPAAAAAAATGGRRARATRAGREAGMGKGKGKGSEEDGKSSAAGRVASDRAKDGDDDGVGDFGFDGLGQDSEEEGEDKDKPSPPKKHKKAAAAAAPASAAAAAVAPARRSPRCPPTSPDGGDDDDEPSAAAATATATAGGRKNKKAPLAARKQEQEQRLAPEARGAKAKKKAALSASAAAAGSGGGGAAAAAAPTRGKKAPSARDVAAAPGGSSEARRGRRKDKGRKGEVEKQEGLRSGAGQADEEDEDDSEDAALMRLSRRRRAMQE